MQHRERERWGKCVVELGDGWGFGEGGFVGWLVGWLVGCLIMEEDFVLFFFKNGR